MDKLEKERKKVELLRVHAAKAEMQLAILVAEKEIERLNAAIIIQEAKEKELTELIAKN